MFVQLRIRGRKWRTASRYSRKTIQADAGYALNAHDCQQKRSWWLGKQSKQVIISSMKVGMTVYPPPSDKQRYENGRIGMIGGSVRRWVRPSDRRDLHETPSQAQLTLAIPWQIWTKKTNTSYYFVNTNSIFETVCIARLFERQMQNYNRKYRSSQVVRRRICSDDWL